MALYAEEDEEQVYRNLDLMQQKYPSEFEFYIPQLCTYLFHFEGGADEEEEKALEIGSPVKEEEQIQSTSETPVQNSALK